MSDAQQIEFLGTRDDGLGFLAWFRSNGQLFGLNRKTLQRRMALQRRIPAYAAAMEELTERESDEDGDGERFTEIGHSWCKAR
jgi:hypothetical protein